MIADILVELAWKSTVVAAAVVLMLAVMRRQAAENRAAIGGLGIAMLLLLPLAVLALTFAPAASFDIVAPIASADAPLPLLIDPAAPILPFSAAPEAAAPAMRVEWMLAAVWGAGAFVVLMRLATGLMTLRRWTERAEPVSAPHWQSLLRTSGVPAHARLMVSSDVAAPLSWGWRTPVILIDHDTLVQAQGAESVIAHEAAHLKRGDWPRLLAARLVLALFWFNPLVWLLERLYLQAVEEAADAEATRTIAPARYAQVLLNAARNVAVPVGANSMTSGALSKRIQKILQGRRRSRWTSAWRVGALTSVAAVAAPVAAIEVVAPSVPTPLAAAANTGAAAEPTSLTAPAITAAPLARIAPTAPAAIAPEVGVSLAKATAAVAAVQANDITGMSEADREAVRAAAAAAGRAAKEAGAHAQIAAREASEVAAKAQAMARTAMADARVAMRNGADEMERGAIEMRKGAAQMREEARKLRSPAYRAEVIRKARLRGDHVPTDQELIDAIPKMEEGARKMDAGVDDMRRGAQRMREQASRQD